MRLKSLLRLFKEAIRPSPEKAEVVSECSMPMTVTDIKIGEALESAILSDSIQELANENDSLLYGSQEFTNAEDQDLLTVESTEHTTISALPEQENKLTPSVDMDDKIYETETMKKLTPSLLENKSFIKVVEECVDVMDEFESYIERVETDEGKMIAEIVVKRLQELLERSGLHSINDTNEPFSILRHVPSPMSSVPEGIRIQKIIRLGLAIENRVFRRAIVEIDHIQ